MPQPIAGGYPEKCALARCTSHAQFRVKYTAVCIKSQCEDTLIKYIKNMAAYAYRRRIRKVGPGFMAQRREDSGEGMAWGKMTKMQSFSVLIPKDRDVFRTILPKAVVVIKGQMRMDYGKMGFSA